MKFCKSKSDQKSDDVAHYLPKSYVVTRKIAYWPLIIVGLAILTRTVFIYLGEQIVISYGDEAEGRLRSKSGGIGWSTELVGIGGKQKQFTHNPGWISQIVFKDASGNQHIARCHSDKPASGDVNVLYWSIYPKIACVKEHCGDPAILYRLIWGASLFLIGFWMRWRTKKLISLSKKTSA